MSKYTFSMKKILDWRSDKEEEARRKVTDAEQKQQQQEAILQQLISENIKLKQKSLLTGRIDAMRQQDLYKKLLDDKIVQQKLVVEQAANETERAKQALLEAHKEKKMMEKLDEKERAQYIANEKYEEQKQLDEISTINFGRVMYQ